MMTLELARARVREVERAVARDEVRHLDDLRRTATPRRRFRRR